jgi:D-inositol-3-phosphate glycosyltransferase
MKNKVALVMVHTSPLEQAGIGDAGGMNIYVIESAKRMAAGGVDVDIFTRRISDEQPEVIEYEKGIRIIHLSLPVGVKKEEIPSLIPAMAEEFKKKVQGQGYQIIHSHYWISGKVAMPAAKEFGIPLVHTMHTMARVKNAALAEGENAEPMIRVQGESQIVEAANALIANTDAEAASLVSLYDACPDNVAVVAPGVDLYNFTPNRKDARKNLGLDATKLIVSFVGRIQPHKGPEVLIRAINEMMGHNPELRAQLQVLITGGASGVRNHEDIRLRELVNWLKLDDVIKFLDPVSREKLPDLYRASDLVCVPSYSESFGLVALEAQACGTPVVASAVGGLRTAVADGISGVLVDGHNPKAWSSVIARLLMEPQRRILLSLGAVEHASHFGWDATARGTLDVYDRLIKHQPMARYAP